MATSDPLKKSGFHFIGQGTFPVYILFNSHPPRRTRSELLIVRRYDVFTISKVDTTNLSTAKPSLWVNPLIATMAMASGAYMPEVVSMYEQVPSSLSVFRFS